MKRIHVARNRQPLGHFAPEEIETGLRSGRFMPSDLGWSEPMDSWKPLSEFTDLPVSETLPPPVPVEPPVQPEWPVNPVEPLLAQSAPVEPAWERRQEIGLVKAMVATVKAILSSPTATFKNLKADGGIGHPILFYWIIGTIAGWVSMLYQIGIVTVNPEMAMGTAAKEMTPAQMGLAYAFLFFLWPFVVVVIPFVAAAIFHGILMIMGGASKGYEATFRVFCYGWGAALLFQFIPACGPYVTIIWGVVLLAIGLKEVHRTDYVRTIVTTILPVLLCCGGLFAALASMAAAMGAGFK